MNVFQMHFLKNFANSWKYCTLAQHILWVAYPYKNIPFHIFRNFQLKSQRVACFFVVVVLSFFLFSLKNSKWTASTMTLIVIWYFILKTAIFERPICYWDNVSVFQTDNVKLLYYSCSNVYWYYKHFRAICLDLRQILFL